MVSSTLTKRIKSLELLATPKQAMLVLQCYDAPSAAQLDEIAKAESAGRRFILFGNHYSWVWLGGDDAQRPWETDNSAYNFNRSLA